MIFIVTMMFNKLVTMQKDTRFLIIGNGDLREATTPTKI